MKFLHKILPLFLILLLILCNSRINSQNAGEIFGKNKVQYNNDLYDWWIYETNNFVIYWYGKSRPSAQFCIEIAETENNQVQKLFEYHLKDKIELVIYADASDQAQSNIDLDAIINDKNWNLEPKIKGQKILMYFDGDHENLRNLLRSGITKIYFNSMFSGTALQDVVQKVISFRLPDWFEKGLIQYLSTGWKEEDQIHFFSKWKESKFKKFSNRYPEIAGKSFWNFLTNTYGEQAISNWLYMTRIQKDIQIAARSVFSQSFSELQSDWFNFYKIQLNKSTTEIQENLTTNKLKLKNEEKIINIKLGLNSNQNTITTQQNSKGRIYHLNKNLKDKKRIFKNGSRSKLYKPDFNYPIYSSLVKENLEYYIYEKRNRVYLHVLNIKTKQNSTTIFPEEIQRVYAADVLNKDVMIMSANTNGYSDIILYNLKSRQFQKLTNDIWDDLDLKIMESNNTSEVIYRSNKPEVNDNTTKIDSVLPLGRFKIYSIDLNNLQEPYKQKLILEIPNKSIISWTKLDSQYLISITENDGIHWLLFNGTKSYEILNDIHPELIAGSNNSDSVFAVLKSNDKYLLEYYTLKQLNQKQTEYKESSVEILIDSSQSNSNATINTDTSYFQSQFGNPKNIIELLNEFEKKKTRKTPTKISTFTKYKNIDYPNTIDFNSNLAIAYRNRFQIEEISSTINNELLFSGLNTFSGTSQNYEAPPIGVLLKMKVSEIFENYSLETGIRIPTNFNGLESYLLFENRKKRIDKTYAFYFKTNTDVLNGNFSTNLKKQTRVYLLNNQLKYAFDHYKSIRAISTLRNDHIAYLSTNKATLEDSIELYQQRVGTRLEYVFDNSIDISLNIRNGWQAKIYLEFSKRFDLNPINKSKFYPGALWIAGFDARYHIPFLKKSVFSTRAFSNISFGQDRILYHVGGTENWLLPQYENQNPLETSGEYVYSALATEVRSYGYGARKASSVFGLNTEVRIPFLQYILNQNWKNSILRNFQFIAFFDAAFVWDGFIPNFKESSTQNYHAENPVVKIDLEYIRDPYIFSSGIGLRTALFGYFLRFDYGWKLESSTIKKPNYSFSLGLDF
ncbi:MAG: hypothetical protein WAS55_05485 [Saprospiraceae bacterium]